MEWSVAMFVRKEQMNSWVLIVYILGTGMTPVSGYASKSKCIEAGNKIVQTEPAANYVCTTPNAAQAL